MALDFQNPKQLLLIAAGLIGAGYLLKNMSKPAEQDDETPKGGGGGYGGNSNKGNESGGGGAIGGGVKAGAGKAGSGGTVQDSIDLKLKKGSKSGSVTKVQYIINQIQSMRGQRSATDPGTGKKVAFPISADGAFGNETAAGARVAFGNEYQRNGYITLRKAREQLARTAGYYQKPFPSNLVGVSNESDLHKIYNANIASGASSGGSSINTTDALWNAGAAAANSLFFIP